MAGVVLDQVSKRYGSVTAVERLSLEVEDGEFLVLVGPSGCGKSTILRMVAGLEEVTEGTVRIGHRVVNDVPPKDRDIAMVFQSYALYPHMSVYDNMAFGLQLRRIPTPEIGRRVRAAAEMLGLQDLLGRKPKQLSGGQRQRVAVGRAIVREPQVFLMDEPLSNLDAKLRVQTRAELIKLYHRLGTTVIYVTHDQVEAMTMGTRIAVMKDGVLQQLATPQQLYERPANTFVGAFIGSPAMNFFRCRLSAAGSRLTATADGLCLPLPPDRQRLLARWGEREVVVGVRPEHLRLRREAPAGEATSIQGEVEVIENLGSESIVSLRGAAPFTARLEYDPRLRPGDRLDLVAPPDRLHLFDPTTEQAVA
ncbi:MAG: sn-glycerol-3-phosphate ABC transporter ATP-binding protein UgpC [Chloroflexi bacterium]|nr:sn-glycerol-3-phosphate ABC transporter ATP-binding protein UgpC [Chloroflexota bacterium]